MGDQGPHRNAALRCGLERRFQFSPIEAKYKDVDAFAGAFDGFEERFHTIARLDE
jgi:hypothetical protein